MDATTAAAARRRSWRGPAIALAAVTAVVASFWALADHGTQYEISVDVYLTPDATTLQKAKIEHGLAQLHPSNGIEFTSRETLAKGYGALLGDKSGQPSDLAAIPEMYHLHTSESHFSCTKVAPMSHAPGVARFEISRYARRGGSTVTPVTCG